MMTLKRFLTSGTVALLLAVQSFAGTVTGVQQNAQGGPVANGTYTFQLTAPATIAGVASIATSTVNCYTDASGNVVGEPNPLVLPITSVNLASGTLAAGNYFVKIWYFDGSGNSFPSPEVSVNLASPGTLTILSPIKQPANASGYRVGISTVSGSETLQGSVTGTPGSWGNFSQSVPLTVPAAAAPVSNTTVCSLHFNDEMTPSFVCYNVGLTYGANGASVPGYPQYWYLAGGANGIVNIANGTPQANVCAQQGIFYPQAILALPPFGSPQSIGGPLNIGGALAVPQINKRIYVDGSIYPVTQAGIQQAFTDACALGNPAGTDVYLPVGTVVTVTNTTAQQFLITCPLHVHGPGVNAFWFIYGSSVPSGVPLFRIKPSVADNGWYEFDDFRVTSGSAVGGDVFFLDSTTAGINHLRIHDVSAQGMATTSWFLNMSATIADRYFFGHLWDNQIEGGINLNSTSVSDSWLFEHNTFGAATGNVNPCLNATTEIGSSHFTMFNNNGGCAGGFFISHGTTQCKILYNQIEQPSATTEANSAIIDLIGDTYAIDGCEIVGNNLNAHTFVTNNIRIGTATNTKIRGNVINLKPTTGVGIVLTAASSGTVIDNTNELLGLGGGAIAMTNGTGVNPFLYSFPTATGTLPATIQNDSAGGFQVITNNGKSWDFQNTSNLATPAGVGINFTGGTSGQVSINPPNVAGSNTITVPAVTGTLNATVASIDLTAQTAAQGTTTLFAVPATGAGQYLFSWNAKVTTAAGVSSTLGPMTLTYTDPDGVTITTVVSATQAAGGITVSGATTNTTSTFLIGTPLLINAKASTNIQVAFAYASNAANAMNYNLHEKLVAF